MKHKKSLNILSIIEELTFAKLTTDAKRSVVAKKAKKIPPCLF